jgi:branched-chain amino acid transport system permease protein
MTLIGGAGSFMGPLLGSVIYTFLQAVVTMFTSYWPLTIGTIILLIVLFVPGGVLGLVEKRIKARHGRLGDAGNTARPGSEEQ